MSVDRFHLGKPRGSSATAGRRAAFAVFAIALLLSFTQLNEPAGGATVSTCVLTPVLRDFTVNQGVGSYSPLARGKETEVRLYLSKPSCATSRQAISLTSATLTMTIPGAAAKTYTTLNNVSTTSPAPLYDYTSAAAPDATGDPKFVIPGTDLISSDPTTRFTASFNATITYSSSTSATNPALTFSAVSGGASLSATVEKRTKALRILVVPMGGALSSTDSSTMQAGLNSLSRMLPVPKAGGQLTGPLSSTSSVGGIRYAVNSGVASVPLTNGKYCGNLNNFDAIKAELAQYRNDWNAANSANTTNPDTNPTADIVLGVISSSISLSSDSGCADGMASTSSPEAWVRLVPPTTIPSTAGNLMAMEVAHTFGAEGKGTSTSPWADPFNPTHSKNLEADAATNRAYNVTTRSFLADDRTAMKSQGTGWNQETTVYEQRDYNFLMCRLGGAPNTDCLTTGMVGTINGVGAGPTFLLSGTTDNTAAGTHVVESFTNENVAFTTAPSTSRYTLQFLHGSTVVSQTPVVADFATSDHDGSPNPDQTAPTGLVTVAVPFNLAADPNHIVLKYQPPSGAAITLFSSNKNGQPTLRNFNVSGSPGGQGTGFVNYTNNPAADETQPALSQDGNWLAWVDAVDGTTLEVAPTSDIGASASTYFNHPYGLTHPAWNPAGTKVAFADRSDGDLYLLNVGYSSSASPFGSETKIYDSQASGSVGSADNPSFSPDGSQIAFDGTDVSGRRDIYTMKSDGTNVAAMTSAGVTPNGSFEDPSWSQTPNDDRIAFNGSDGGQSGIFAVIPSDPTPGLLVGGGSEPSWGTDGVIAFTNFNVDGGSTIGTFCAGDSCQTPAIDGQAGSYPAYVSKGTSAFVRSFPLIDTGSQYDVMLESPDASALSISATGGIVGGSTDQQSLDNLRLTLYYQCPGSPERSVLGLALKPTGFADVGTAQASASFNQKFDESQLCGGQGGGTVTGVLSDFFTSAPLPGQRGFDPIIQNEDIANSSQGPVASIVDPQEEATFFDWESVALQGEGMDGSLRQLSDANLSWTVTGPVTRSGQGSTVDLARLPVGDYSVKLTATDPGTGKSDETTSVIHVVADSDHDGLSDTFESSQTCFAPGAADDGNSINSDSEGDGIPDGQDPAPCTAATTYHPTVTFDPATLYVPSNGTYVTVTVKPTNGTPSLRSLVPGSVRLRSIRGVPLGGTTAETRDVSGEGFSTAKAWSVSGATLATQLGTAKFDRKGLNTYIKNTFKLSQVLTMTFTGYSSVPAWSFSGSGTTTVKKG